MKSGTKLPSSRKLSTDIQVSRTTVQTAYELIDDHATGMVVNFSRYPAGYYKEFHTHACSHGIYVLSGTLKTDKGEYGPGCFVWHQEGVVARHGATDREDCYALFITNKPFEISYPDEK